MLLTETDMNVGMLSDVSMLFSSINFAKIYNILVTRRYFLN